MAKIIRFMSVSNLRGYLFCLKEQYLCQTATEMAQRNRQRRQIVGVKGKN